MNENVLKEEIAMLENQIRILQQENQELKADYGTKAQVERDMLQQENRELKKQLDYLRSGEYLNQLKFERNMLEDLVQEEKLSNEVYSIKKIMQANTRLAEKNQELNKQLEDISEELELVRCDLHNRTSERDGYERELNECLSQQKEFIKWLENGIEKVKNTEFFDERIQKAGLIAYNRVLSKYKEILSKGENK